MRSLTNRNLLGGFLGGVLGIIFFELIFPLMLPLGCLIGVAIGWLYQEIWECVVRSWSDSLGKAASACRRMGTEFRSSRFAIGRFCGRCAECLMLFLAGIAKAASFAFGVLTFSRPVLWVKAHPMNAAYAIQWLITIAIASVTIWFCFWGVRHTWIYDCYAALPKAEQDSLRGGWVLACFLMAMIPFLLTSIHQDSGITEFFREFQLYDRLGAARYSAKVVFRIVAVQAFSVVYVPTILAFFIAVGLVFLSVLLVVPSAIIGSLKAAYHIALKSGMWLCFGTTLSVTAASALLASPYLHDKAWLWMTALLAGTLSGFATEGMRRLLAAMFARYARLSALAASSFEDSMSPSWSAFWRIASGLGNGIMERLAVPVRAVMA